MIVVHFFSNKALCNKNLGVYLHSWNFKRDGLQRIAAQSPRSRKLDSAHITHGLWQEREALVSLVRLKRCKTCHVRFIGNDF